MVLQVMIVGDLNVAASQADVHNKYSYDRMYSTAEKEALQALLNPYTDIWRRLHPNMDSVFTVWDEKTSARVFNEVCLCTSFCSTAAAHHPKCLTGYTTGSSQPLGRPLDHQAGRRCCSSGASHL